MEENKIILLAGPTSSGKSKLAILLAKKLDGEIINADSMQVYKELSILTSRPSKSDLKKINHHLYGFKSAKNNFSVGEWLKQTTKIIKKLIKSNKTPIIVGGTGLYFKSLTDGLVNLPNIPISLRTRVRKMHKLIGQKEFYYKLIKLDPLAKNFVLPMDAQRSMRAYEVKKKTNISLSIWFKKTKSNYDEKKFVKFFINSPRYTLHNSINKRVETMFQENVLLEVKKYLKKNVNKDSSANKIIGIKEISNYLEKKINLIDTKELIKQRTRQYAKRQFTWCKGHMKSWHKIYSSNIKDLCKQIIYSVSKT